MSDMPASTAPAFTLHDKLAAIGLCCKKSRVGFLIWFADVMRDTQSKNALDEIIQTRFVEAFQSFKGAYSEYVPYALSKLAMQELLTLDGQVCAECHGTGIQVTKARQSRKCQACLEGLIEWSNETRYGFFVHQFPIRMKRFKQFLPIYTTEMARLKKERLSAQIVLEEHFKDEAA